MNELAGQFIDEVAGAVAKTMIRARDQRAFIALGMEPPIWVSWTYVLDMTDKEKLFHMNANTFVDHHSGQTYRFREYLRLEDQDFYNRYRILF